MPIMDPLFAKLGDRIQHPDFGEGVLKSINQNNELTIEWDRQGLDVWDCKDKRWEQVLLA